MSKDSSTGDDKILSLSRHEAFRQIAKVREHGEQRTTREADDAWVQDTDPRYEHPVVARLILEFVISVDHALNEARVVVYSAMDQLQSRYGFRRPLEALLLGFPVLRRLRDICPLQAFFNALGYDTIVEPPMYLAIKSLVARTQRRRGDSMAEKLADELAVAYFDGEPPPGPR